MKFLAVCLVGALAVAAHAIDPPIWRGPISGAVTADSAWVKAKLRRIGSSARLAVSTNVELKDALWFGPSTATDASGAMVDFRVTGLRPDTQYFYGLEVNGVLHWMQRGAFRTFPPTNAPASFNFAFGSCARTGSENPVFDRIRELRPLFFLHTGDFHYENITSNALVKFRMAYDRVLFSSRQSALYRAVPLVYVWDDHDFAGNNSDRRAPAHFAARRIYEEYMPHYDTPAGERDVPIYQTFAVGRVKFILTDQRSERDPVDQPDGPGKSMLGAAQKAWFKNELRAAKGQYPLIVWVSSVPWIGTAGANYYPIRDHVTGFIHQTNAWQFARDPALAEQSRSFFSSADFWGAFAEERREIANFIRDEKITGLVILHGDAHSLAADDGTHSDYTTGGGPRIPVLAGAPLDQDASIKGGPYSQGVYKPVPGEGCFGYVQVRDSGTKIDVRYSGRNYRGEEKLSLKFSVPVN